MLARKYSVFFLLTGFFSFAIAQTDGMLCEIIVTQSPWAEFFKGLPSAFVALVIGCIASWIAWHQYHVAKAKLKFDLFEKRLVVFNIAQDFLPKLMNTELSLSEIDVFYRSVRSASFLFGKEIADYLKAINEKAIMAHAIGLRLKANRNVMHPDDIKSHTELSEWVVNETQNGLKQKFSKYLNFDNWH